MSRQTRLLAFTLPLAAACYTYTPTQAGAVRPGAQVRTRITPSASQNIAPLLGISPRVLKGKLISEGRDTVVLEVPAVTQAEIGSSVQTLNQRVSLARGEVIEWEIRSLNRRRTYALVGGVAVLLGVTLVNALKGEPGSEPPPGNGGVDALIPLFRFSR